MENAVRVRGGCPQIVVVCFGAPSISGDALGPEVGSLLREDGSLSAFVYGTLGRPITGKNMKEWLPFIEEVHPNAVIISVDASLGEKSKVGTIVMRNDGVCPAAVGGRKKRFGDVGILGIVGRKDGDALAELLQASPYQVSEMADKIAFYVKTAVSEFVSASFLPAKNTAAF